MARPRETASETDSKPVTGRAATKAKTTAAQAAQQEFLLKHVTSNGPEDRPSIKPLDFESLPMEALANYNSRYGITSDHPLTTNGYILQSEIGKKTYTSRKHVNRITKKELAGAIKTHFLNMPVRENEMVTNFLYKVRNQDKDFKLSLK